QSSTDFYTLSLHDALPICKLLNVDDVEFRIAERFGEDAFRLGIDRLANAVVVLRIKEVRVDTKLRQRELEQIVSSTVKRSGGNRSEEHTSELQSRENLVCR